MFFKPVTILSGMYSMYKDIPTTMFGITKILEIKQESNETVKKRIKTVKHRLLCKDVKNKLHISVFNMTSFVVIKSGELAT